MEKASTLPSMELPFDIQVAGRETKTTFAGHFKYRRPTLGTRSRVNAMEARLNGDLTTLDQDTIDFNRAIAHLRFTLDDYPDWWRDASFGMDLYDANVVAEIYNRCMKFENEWQTKVFGGDASKVVDGATDTVKESVVGATTAPQLG